MEKAFTQAEIDRLKEIYESKKKLADFICERLLRVAVRRAKGLSAML